MNIIETDRLILRKATRDDAAFILDLLNQPSFIRFIGDRNVRTLDAASEYIVNRLAASYEKNGFGLYLTALKDSQIPVGLCGLVKRDALKDVDIGFAFLAEYESKGYGYESAAAVMEYARSTLGIPRIVAIVDPTNEKSIGLLKKLGLQFESMVKLADDDIDLKMFG